MSGMVSFTMITCISLSEGSSYKSERTGFIPFLNKYENLIFSTKHCTQNQSVFILSKWATLTHILVYWNVNLSQWNLIKSLDTFTTSVICLCIQDDHMVSQNKVWSWSTMSTPRLYARYLCSRDAGQARRATIGYLAYKPRVRAFTKSIAVENTRRNLLRSAHI